jgi:hypothetical protein
MELIRLAEEHDKQFGGIVLLDFAAISDDVLLEKLKNRKGRKLVLVSDTEKLDKQDVIYG